MSSASSSASHLSSQLVLGNLPLFGFGDDEESLWMTTLELVHNSLDSLKSSALANINPRNAVTRPELKISFTKTLEDAACMQVSVFDNGCGIASLTDSLQCFYSTKTGPRQVNTLSAGRFGVGLSACILNSWSRTGRDMTIVTTPSNSTMTAVVVVSFDQARGGQSQKEKKQLF